nr:hypothetical protein [Tanacetum cinerariifolium]
DTGSKTVKEPVNKEDQAYKDELDRLLSQEKEASDEAVNVVSTLGTFSAGGPSSPHLDAFIPPYTLLYIDQDDSQVPDLEDITELQSTGIFNSAYDDDLDIFTSPVRSVGIEANFNSMESSTIVSPQDTNGNADTQDNIDVRKEVSDQHYIVLPLWYSISYTFKSSDDKAADDKPKDDTGSKTVKEPVNKEDQAYKDELDRLLSQEKEASDEAGALRMESKQGCMDQR